jgi:hypothetical protein
MSPARARIYPIRKRSEKAIFFDKDEIYDGLVTVAARCFVVGIDPI